MNDGELVDSNPSSMRIKEIRQELESMGIVTKSFIEKSEFVNALINARKEGKAPGGGGASLKTNNCDEDATADCCAECGKAGGGDVSLKMCKSCMQIKYCSATCQKNHWAKHKKPCKQRAADLRDEALFKDQPPKEDCPICFLPLQKNLLSCASLPPATVFVSSTGKGITIPILDFENKYKNAAKAMVLHYPCCGKTICKGCIFSFCKAGNDGKCPFCNSNRYSKSQQEIKREIMKWVDANDPVTMRMLAQHYKKGEQGFPQDHVKAMEVYNKSAELGCSDAHLDLGYIYEHEQGDLKKAKFHYEEAAMLGDVEARSRLGRLEFALAKHEQPERALKHWTIGASAGCHHALYHLSISFGFGRIPRKSMESIVTAYNASCVEMRSESRDAYIQAMNF